MQDVKLKKKVANLLSQRKMLLILHKSWILLLKIPRIATKRSDSKCENF